MTLITLMYQVGGAEGGDVHVEVICAEPKDRNHQPEGQQAADTNARTPINTQKHTHTHTNMPQ